MYHADVGKTTLEIWADEQREASLRREQLGRVATVMQNLVRIRQGTAAEISNWRHANGRWLTRQERADALAAMEASRISVYREYRGLNQREEGE